MAYQKQEWVANTTVISADRMNHIEQGIANIELTPGEPGITPQLRNGESGIEVSYDNGQQWQLLVPFSQITGPQGEPGTTVKIYKTYASVDEMNADAANVPEGSLVMIVTDVNQEDNGKIYSKGADGFVFVIDVSGMQGIQGEPGPQGEPGVTPVITVAAETLPAGSQATAVRSGTDINPTITFGIPAGADGAQGAPGQDGKTPVISAVAVQVPYGTPASVEQSGTADAPVFTFNIPQGEPGTTPDMSNVVQYQDFEYGGETRKTIQLANYDSISGVGTDGEGYNLIMLSKWDKVDIGTPSLTMNLNSKDGIVQINDEKVVATTDDVNNLGVCNLGDFTTAGQAEAKAAEDGFYNNAKYTLFTFTVNGNECGYIINSVSTAQTTQYLTWQGIQYKRTVTQDGATSWYKLGAVKLQGKAIVGPKFFALTTESTEDEIKAAMTSAENNLITVDDLNTCLTTGMPIAEYSMQSGSIFVGYSGQGFTFTYIGFPSPNQDPAVMSCVVNVTDDGHYTVLRNATKGVILTSNTLASNATFTALESRVSDTESCAPKMFNIPIRSLKDQVYDKATILGWFGVEDEVGLKTLIAGDYPLFVKYGISLSTNPHYYKFLVEYIAFESDTQVKMVFTGLDTSNDKHSKYVMLFNLDEALIDETQSNVSMVVTALEA